MLNLYLQEYEEYTSRYGDDPTYWQTLARQYAWGIPNQEALEVLAAHAPIVEMGAGTGYWAHLLRQMGVDVLPYDRFPPARGKNPYGHQDPWVDVIPGTPDVLANHPDRALFLCWPPSHVPMALDSLRSYSGDTVIYVGEAKGGGTGTPEFHDFLKAHFHLGRTVEIPTWERCYDFLAVWYRHMARYTLTYTTETGEQRRKEGDSANDFLKEIAENMTCLADVTDIDLVDTKEKEPEKTHILHVIYDGGGWRTPEDSYIRLSVEKKALTAPIDVSKLTKNQLICLEEFRERCGYQDIPVPPKDTRLQVHVREDGSFVLLVLRQCGKVKTYIVSETNTEDRIYPYSDYYKALEEFRRCKNLETSHMER